jgi:hypothetical protein
VEPLKQFESWIDKLERQHYSGGGEPAAYDLWKASLSCGHELEFQAWPAAATIFCGQCLVEWRNRQTAQAPG